MLDLCLALGVPAPRFLEQILTPGELDEWFRKMARDQFSQHGHDVRDAVAQARLFSALAGLAGKKRTYSPKRFLVRFEPRKPMSDDVMKQMLKGVTRKMGGKVT